ncbi:unnamed protein product, partial [Meganyctiphanes norvegica]
MKEIGDEIEFLAVCRTKHFKNVKKHIFELTGTKDGIALLSSNSQILKCVLGLIRDSEKFTAKDAVRTLVNISAEESGASSLLALTEIDIVLEMVKCIQDQDYVHADFACGVLANLTRPKSLCQIVFDRLSAESTKLEGLVYVLCQMNYNKHGAKLHLLAPVITNFSQLPGGRSQLMDRKKCVFQRLLPFTEYHESKGRRKSIIAAIHNCCFEKENHDWLLSEDIDLLSRLLLPLAGPDTFTSEENESLPIDLQFLEDDKQREEDPEIRKLLLETIMQLCITRKCRETLRSQNVYFILRELHKWETDKLCLLVLEDLINILIRANGMGPDDL